jgi:fructose-bisphosphate aldolase class I
MHNLEETVQALIAPGKGILAADATVGTVSKRFESLGIVSTEESRRAYREMLFSTPRLSEFVSGVNSTALVISINDQVLSSGNAEFMSL